MFLCVHVGLQYDRGTDGVDDCLILTLFFLGSSLDHRLVCQDRGEAFVMHDNGNIREFAFERGEERFDIRHTFRVRVIHLLGMSHDNKVYFLSRAIIL